ncbi:RimK/LysX family protein [Flavobacteriaceae bacterium F08102]|nr:RimK/LysX family protein [Flavobacteriaceae bacterium F08102]
MKRKLGRTDIANFPELQLSQIDIKVDTGAYTSSIHCHEVKEVIVANESFIQFKLLDPFHEHYNEKEFVFRNYKKKSVKSSSGVAEERFVIETIIEIFGEYFPIELTLSNRSTMKYPILLGRKFLTKRFIVDPSKTNLSTKQTEKKS